MNSEVQERFNRAKEFLRAAEVLHNGSFPSIAAGRAYYAMFHAATAALLSIGIERSTHRGIIAAFGHSFVKTGKIDKRFNADLRKAYLLRGEGDYVATPDMSVRESQILINAAKDFVAACEAISQ